MRKNDENLIAVIRSSLPPTEDEKRRLSEYLKKVRGIEVPVTWEEDGSITDGFQMEVGSDIYDWTISGRLRQFKESLDKLNPAGGNIIPLIRETVQNWTPEVSAEEMGEVLSVGDEIATVSGLEHAAYGEILQFSNGVKGMVQDLTPDRIGCILFGDSEEISEGSIVRRTGRTAGIPVGDAFLGRVVDALGSPIDGKGDIPADGYRPIEMPAPSIVDRQPVNTPMETGLIAIDSMFPIGRGQRELIIGDRRCNRHHPEPEGEGRYLHLRRHRPEGLFGRPAGGEPLPPRRDGVYDRRQRFGFRFRLPPVYRPLRRLCAGRVLHVFGAGCADRLRRPQ